MKRRAIVFGAWGIAGFVGIAAVAADAVGLRLNVTASAPSGLWWVRAVNPAVITQGMLVAVCPPTMPLVALMRQRGYLSTGDCSAGVAPLLKPVGAVAGDRVRIRAGLPAEVNGVPLVNTRADPGMPAWADGEVTVQPGQMWLFSSFSAGSFDSRYFGPVPAASVRGAAVPVVVVGDIAEMLQEEEP